MNRIEVKTKQTRFPVAGNLYGLFFEDINRAADGGLYPEMLRNRSFEDSIPPDGCAVCGDDEVYVNRGGWPDIFCRGEGMVGWAKSVPETSVPAWYGERARLTLRREGTLNQNRLAALRVDFEEGGTLYNIGYAGVPVKKGESYDFYTFIKADAPAGLTLSLESADGQVYAQSEIGLTASDQYIRYDAALVSQSEDFSARLVLRADRACTVSFGFCSLMPRETFKGHGLRKDLSQLLADTHSKFLRFPGGCVVEGFNLETAMRFPHTIGPVWERPSHNLMWHYRTGNGLGFHEYLQFCEDLNLEPMYVCNCGMSCQARVEELFDEALVETILQETLGAIEYAVGPVSSGYGAVRAAMGHPAPFKMTYLEIGNENWGPAYNERYEEILPCHQGEVS